MKKATLYNIFLLFLLTLSVSGCGYLPAPGPECAEADDFGDISTITVEVDSKSGSWVNSQVSVTQGSSIVKIEVEPGSVLLCGKTENKAVNVDSKTENWTFTDVYVRKGDQLTISVNSPASGVYSGPAAGKYNRWGDSGDPFCSSPSGSNCWMYDGMGLNAKIGGGTDHNDCNIGGCSDGGIILPGGGTSVPASGLWNYSGIPLDTSSIPTFSIWSYVNQGSPLFLRVWDSDGDFSSDNEGGYVATITKYGCPRYNGENLRAFISSDQPDSNKNITDTIDLGPTSSSYTESTEATASGTIWLKIYDQNDHYGTFPFIYPNPTYDQAPGDGSYGNNEGKYKVKITVVSHPKPISDAINWLVDGVKTKLEDAREQVYRHIITSQTARIARAMLALYIIIYGIMFMYGMIEHPQMDFLIRVVKIALIIQLTSPGSWNFFNEYLFTVFTDGSSYLIHIMSNAYTAGAAVTNWTPDQGIEWAFLDLTFSQLFSQSTWIKLAGLLFAFPLGWIYLILIIVAMALYIIGVAWVILAYLLSLVAISLLIAVAPIFILFLLFTKTADLFKKWLNQLFSYALQPVILVALLVMFNFFIVAALIRVLNYAACWKCIWSVNIGFDLCLWSFYIPLGWSSSDPINSLPITVLDILILFIFVKMLPKLIAYAEKTAKMLSSASSGVSLTGLAKGVGESFSEKAKSTVGLDKESRQRRKNAAAGQKLQERARNELAAEDKAKSDKSGKGGDTDKKDTKNPKKKGDQ